MAVRLNREISEVNLVRVRKSGFSCAKEEATDLGCTPPRWPRGSVSFEYPISKRRFSRIKDKCRIMLCRYFIQISPDGWDFMRSSGSLHSFANPDRVFLVADSGKSIASPRGSRPAGHGTGRKFNRSRISLRSVRLDRV